MSAQRNTARDLVPARDLLVAAVERDAANLTTEIRALGQHHALNASGSMLGTLSIIEGHMLDIGRSVQALRALVMEAERC